MAYRAAVVGASGYTRAELLRLLARHPEIEVCLVPGDSNTGAAVGHVVDLGADFRLPIAAYEQWYGERHSAADLLDRFAFGMPELYRDEILAARHVASPGCYPTAAALALAPLLSAGLVEPRGIEV